MLELKLSKNAANFWPIFNSLFFLLSALEVQTKMHEVLESNPDNLQDVVEQDPELKALRDANPLCAELMNDPETMRILVDPDNLRALAECPDLIAADFASPDWAPPDIESVTFDDSTAVPIPMEPLEATSGEEVLVEVAVLEDPDAADVAADAAEEGEAEGEEEQGEEEEEEEEEFMEGFERGEESDTKGAGKLSSSSTASKNRQSSTKERVRAYVTSLGTGLVDYVAGETVGITMSEAGLTGGEENDALEVPDGEGEPIEEEEPEVGEEAEPAESSAADNFAENIEGNMDTIQDAHDSNTDGATTAAVGGTAAAGGVAVAFGQHRQVGDRCSSDDLDEDEMDDNYDGYASPQKGGVMSMAGSFARTSMAALGSATSAQIATSLLGDELGANFIEKLGSKGENTEDEPDQPVKGSMVGRAGRAIRGSVVAMGEAATTTFVGVDISEGLVGRLDGETRGKNDNDGVQKDTQKDK